MKYFLLTSVPPGDVIVDGKRFTFEKTHFFQPTNSWWGVIEVGGADAALLAADKRFTEVDADDYAKLLSRRGTNLIIEVASPDPLPAVPVVKPEVAVEAVTADELLKPRKAARK